MRRMLKTWLLGCVAAGIISCSGPVIHFRMAEPRIEAFPALKSTQVLKHPQTGEVGIWKNLPDEKRNEKFKERQQGELKKARATIRRGNELLEKCR